MFFHQKHYHTNGMFFLLSLIVAFLLGRKSERYGFTIVSRGCGCYEDDDDEMDMMDDPTPTNTYPQ
ncbi:hypothetical protein [Desulfosporosinus nitroreducens]|uniref:hypothetical protein n=1 Tax=Desulfosporosinus nitroreducens TaxID=2018668 RepID=UPI00207C8DB2|nr:hypothetical protein [Desulfosporosinus nitroreducens]MCO1599916.1 hypothetical protein [Desulfosporosinus nitroreducens]